MIVVDDSVGLLMIVVDDSSCLMIVIVINNLSMMIFSNKIRLMAGVLLLGTCLVVACLAMGMGLAWRRMTQTMMFLAPEERTKSAWAWPGSAKHARRAAECSGRQTPTVCRRRGRRCRGRAGNLRLSDRAGSLRLRGHEFAIKHV